MTLAEAPTGPLLRAYLAASRALVPLAPVVLHRRLARGREDAARWREKLGEATAARPDGPLIWFHAVGLGEVLALSGLIGALAAARPDLHFLVTSTARSSAEVFAKNAPPHTQHQFLPLDAAPFIARFLDHWRPDLSVWAEQDLWPGLVVETHRRGIPLALINARMNARAYTARARARGLYRDLYARFSHISAQDEMTARHLGLLGAKGVAVTGSLKAAAAPLADAPEARAALAPLAARRPWLVASSHAEDEAVAFAAASALPERLLIVAPRLPARAAQIIAAARAAGLSVAQRSAGTLPGAETQLYLADTFGEMGLWYRLCPVALVGGSFGAVEGHNPWEPARLGCAILHGPRTANFAADYAALDAAGGGRPVADAAALAAAITAPDLPDMAARARALADRGAAALPGLCATLMGLMR
ncbi:3-deoxy-D-manno-octulosonic acid transferase [Phaeovulum veldkampii]|uniref:3-deoxy-D-manno-octulosonic acid transferase n=1 Tax=Phaeovulum veldkampii TaxID=33049 RepID=UPI00145601CE|nr:glycosyltransferase N-terminal domain-containing protein [Phaeovulum veldkampii]